ncbi:MAG: hypothetical protein J6M62_01755 [Selenomonadaceae bacterium]|nr:hypothetical protein [Selenomonadaceae bacterium]
MELKCPFMGGKKCIEVECSLWVQERILRTDFKSLADKWQETETVLPPHCALNETMANIKAFARVSKEGAYEAEDEKEKRIKEQKNAGEITNWYNSVYMT